MLTGLRANERALYILLDLSSEKVGTIFDMSMETKMML